MAPRLLSKRHSNLDVQPNVKSSSNLQLKLEGSQSDTKLFLNLARAFKQTKNAVNKMCVELKSCLNQLIKNYVRIAITKKIIRRIQLCAEGRQLSFEDRMNRIQLIKHNVDHMMNASLRCTVLEDKINGLIDKLNRINTLVTDYDGPSEPNDQMDYGNLQYLH